MHTNSTMWGMHSAHILLLQLILLISQFVFLELTSLLFHLIRLEIVLSDYSILTFAPHTHTSPPPQL